METNRIVEGLPEPEWIEEEKQNAMISDSL